MVKENEFLGRYLPGLRGLSQQDYVKNRDRLKQSRPDILKDFEDEKSKADKARDIIMCSSAVSMGRGHPDLLYSVWFSFFTALFRYFRSCRGPDSTVFNEC